MTSQRIICIQGGTVVRPTESISEGTVLISRGKITYAGKRRAAPRGAQIVDATGLIVSPGLIDVHIHGAGPTPFEQTFDGAAFRRAATFLAGHGVLRFVLTMMAHEEIMERTASAIDESGMDDVCPGLYIEGPFIAPEKRGGVQSKYVRSIDLTYLRKLERLAHGRLCMMTFAPELEGAAKLVKAMRQMRIRPCVGHSSADIATVATVCGKRPINLTHLFNAMSGLDHKRPGVAAFGLDSPRAFVELNPDGIHVAPELLRLVRAVKPADRIILMSDAVTSAGMPEGEYTYMGRKVSSSSKGVYYVKEGTLVGSSILLNEGVSRYMKFTGAELHEAIRSASLNPAEMLGISSRTGSLEAGKRADIVLFTRNLRKVEAAYRRGVVVAP